MPLIVDCYNVLYAPMPASLAGLDEAGLCRALARSVWRGQRVVVVCDGLVKPHGPDVSPVEGVELRYSGRGRSADDVIVELVDADSAPRRLTVVSSDRQVQKAARRRRCRVVSSEDFIRALAATPGAKHHGADDRRPLTPLSEQEVTRWLKRFGVDGADDKPEDRPWWED